MTHDDAPPPKNKTSQQNKKTIPVYLVSGKVNFQKTVG